MIKMVNFALCIFHHNLKNDLKKIDQSVLLHTKNALYFCFPSFLKKLFSITSRGKREKCEGDHFLSYSNESK